MFRCVELPQQLQRWQDDMPGPRDIWPPLAALRFRSLHDCDALHLPPAEASDALDSVEVAGQILINVADTQQQLV